MMKKSRCFKSIACVLLITGICISNSFAGLVAGSQDSVEIIGNLSGSNGSFKILVDYEVYDGGAGYNPLGATDEYQVVFELTHLGPDDSGEPVMKIGRFTVFTKVTGATDGGSDYDYTGAFNGAGYANQSPDIGGIAPSDPIDPPVETFNNKVQYKFFDDFYDPKFAEGDTSQLLVMKFDPAQMPLQDVLIEINGAAYNINGDERINLVPEPATLLLLAGGAILLKSKKTKQ